MLLSIIFQMDIINPKENNSRETPTMPTKKEIKKLTKRTIKKQRKEFLKQFEGKLEGPYDHLKEGVDYLDDIQRNKETPSPLLHLTPGTEEYKKVEAELIKQICEIDLGDESRFDIV